MAVANRKLFWWSRLTFLLGVVALVFGVSLFGSLPSVKAANCGDANVSGANWDNGQGVDSRSNAPYEGQATNCGASGVHNLNPAPPALPQMGDAWQCVELVQRFYATRTWTSGIFSGVNGAADIYTNASANGWTTQAQGSIVLANIMPGDMLVTNEATFGHVMAVDSVNTGNNTISAVDQNGADGGRTTVTYNPTTKNLSDGTYYHFSGVVHSPNNKGNGGGGSPVPSTPAAVSRSSTSMDLFYNDGYNRIMNYWRDTNGWHSGYWSDNNIAGQPTVTARTSNNLDVFYRTTDGKLEYRAWTVSNGWGNAITMVSSGMSGDPWAISRGSNDMQIFFLYNTDKLASISWDINSGWNLTPQILYSGEKTDPVAASSSSSKMDVFFGKNNNNLVHMGWDPTNGWLTADFSAGNGVDGRPTAITRNGANDFSAYYKELNSGKVAEEAWDINNGWGWQDWNASLSGSPSAITGVQDTIDNFYRETGGNVVDRYFYTCGWCTTNIAGANTSTGNPTAIVRGGTSIEVFYWNGSSLIDNNWNTGSQSWNGGAKIN